MLVKDAKKRATLKEISENPWVAAGDLGLAQILPLVGRDVLPESAHATIIEQMVAGGVDTEENILRPVLFCLCFLRQVQFRLVNEMGTLFSFYFFGSWFKKVIVPRTCE